MNNPVIRPTHSVLHVTK